MKNTCTFFGLFLLGSLLFGQNTPKSCACCDALYRQFDFWVGDWETYTPQNKLAGTNRIVFMQDSCVIQENWTSASGAYTGTSYNFYNPQTQKWHQTWVDNQGASLLLAGGLKGKNMVLYSEEMKNAQGQLYINRITWTPNDDGSVRQLWEVSSDKGKNWKAIFNGLYKRKPQG